MKNSANLENLTYLARHNIAALSSMIVMAAGIATPGTAEASTNRSKPSTVPETTGYPDQLRHPSSLPGYNQPLSPETRQQASDSTVALRLRFHGSDKWTQGCTAKKVIIDGNVRLSSAAHCFSILTGDQDGIINKTPGQPKAIDYALGAKNFIEYGVFDPKEAPHDRQLLAGVDGISIAPNQDWAILKVTAPENSPQAAPRTFDQIPALELASKQEKALARPKLGQRVALHGVQAANGERQVTGLGRYLGRVRTYSEDGSIIYQDIVGIKPGTIAEDMCMPGNSGTSFVSTGKNRSTYVSGALSGVVNETWGPALFDNYPGDSRPNDVTNEISGAKDWRIRYQNQLKVDTRSFSTLCVFAANLPGSVNTLNSAFGVGPVRPDEEAVGFAGGKDDGGIAGFAL